jgi:hypothetical protein
MFQKANDPVALAVHLVNTWDELEPDPELLRMQRCSSAFWRAMAMNHRD